MFYLKQSTAATIVIGPFVDSTDGATAETGLTISQADVRLSKNGGAFAQVNESTSASHMENGYYSKALDTTDTNTLGQLLVCVSESGALPVWREFTVLAQNVFDSLVGSGDLLATSATATAIKAVTDKLNTTLEGAAGSPGEYRFTADALETAPTGGSAGPTAAEIADAVWDESVSGHTSAGTFGKALDDTDDRGARTVVRGTVSSGSTTSMTPSALSPAGAAVDQFKGRVIIFDNDTSTAALRGQATDITASTGVSLPQFTFSALSDAPQSGDTFSIV